METLKRQKIALFGGTFDPFHKGHLELLENINGELCPDRIIIVPTGHPYMKERLGRRITPADDRIGMIVAGLSGATFKWEISRVEIERNGPSYSVDTVAEIKQGLQCSGNCEIYFLCGSDVLFGIDKWYEYKRLLADIILTITPRGSDDMSQIMERKKELEDREGARILITEFRGREISSSGIRDNIEVCKDLIPASELDYIKTHHLYEPEA